MSDVSVAGLQPHSQRVVVTQVPDTFALRTVLARKICSIGGLAAACLLSLSAMQPALAQNANAQSVKIGEADLTPAIRIDYVSNSNAFRTPDDEIEATGVIVAPEATFRADRRLLSIELGYYGAYGLFSEDVLDYDDHTVSATVNAELSSRHRIASTLRFINGHDAVGTNLTLGLPQTGDDEVEWFNSIFNTQYTFGAVDARGNVSLGLRLLDRTFLNRSDVTDGRDYTNVSPYGRFSYRLSSDTRLFAELRLNDIDIEDGIRSRTEIETSLGLSFRGTGKTGGEARIGLTSADFDNSNIDDTTLVSANVDLYYEVSSVSRFDLLMTRELNNVDAVSGGVPTSDDIDDELNLIWSRDWSGFVSTRVLLGAEIRNRTCPNLGSESTSAGFELGLKPRRWVEVGAGITFSERGDDNCPQVADIPTDLSYTRQFFNVFIRATL